MPVPQDVIAAQEAEWKPQWPTDRQELVGYYQGLIARLEYVQKALGQLQQGVGFGVGVGAGGYAAGGAGAESVGTLMMEMQWTQKELTDLERAEPALIGYRPGSMDQHMSEIAKDVARGAITPAEGQKRTEELFKALDFRGAPMTTVFEGLPSEATNIPTFLTPYEEMVGVGPGGLDPEMEQSIIAHLTGMPSPQQQQAQAWEQSFAERAQKQKIGQQQLGFQQDRRQTQWAQNFQQSQFNAQQAQQAWQNQFQQQQLASQMGSNIGSQQAAMWAQAMPRALPPGTQYGIGYGPGGIVSQMFPGQQIPGAMPMQMPSATAPYAWAQQFMQGGLR